MKEGRKETKGGERVREKSIEWKNGKLYEVKCDAARDCTRVKKETNVQVDYWVKDHFCVKMPNWKKRKTRKKFSENDLDEEKNPIKMYIVWKSKFKTWATADGYERCAMRKKNPHEMIAKHFHNKDERNSLSRAFFSLQWRKIQRRKTNGTFGEIERESGKKN